MAVWGPSAAGKTAYLAQLFIEGGGDGWSILPTEDCQDFIETMRERILQENHFPEATSYAHSEKVVYRFHEAARDFEAWVHLEDRAGVHSEDLDEAGRQRLSAAEALLLLFDPSRDKSRLEGEVRKSLDRLHVTRGKEAVDPRPIAICLSKADLRIRSAEDWRQAREEPEAFVKGQLSKDLLEVVRRRCSNVRYFPVSAVSLKSRWGAVEPLAFFDESLQPRLVRATDGTSTLNLLDPFVWLFSELRRIP